MDNQEIAKMWKYVVDNGCVDDFMMFNRTIDIVMEATGWDEDDVIEFVVARWEMPNIVRKDEDNA